MTTWKTRIRIVSVLCAAGVCLLATDLPAHRTKGPFGSFRSRYTQAPVVERTVETKRYDIFFSAFDMGHEVHIIAYARLHGKKTFYQDMVRVSMHGPDGHAMTVYRDHATEVLDEPIRWAYRKSGRYTATVELRPYRSRRYAVASATFSMMLARKSPTPVVLTSATGIIVAAMLTVVMLKRRQRSAKRA